MASHSVPEVHGIRMGMRCGDDGEFYWLRLVKVIGYPGNVDKLGVWDVLYLFSLECLEVGHCHRKSQVR